MNTNAEPAELEAAIAVERARMRSALTPIWAKEAYDSPELNLARAYAALELLCEMGVGTSREDEWFGFLFDALKECVVITAGENGCWPEHGGAKRND